MSNRESALVRKQRYAAYELALTAAHLMARAAQTGMTENMNACDCGFAWVTVHDRAFQAWCSKRAKETGNKHFYGSKHWQGGWQFWKPGNAPVQSVGIHEAGAKAFRDTLATKLNLSQCYMGSRLD